MNTSGEAADQVVRMSLEVGEAALKISGTGAKHLAVMLYTVLKEKKKTKGRARLETLVKSGRPLTVFSVKESDLKQFVQEAKRYGVLYCAVRNPRGSSDGLVDVIVKEEDAPRINRIVDRFQFASVTEAAKIKTEIERTRAEKAKVGKSEKQEKKPEKVQVQQEKQGQAEPEKDYPQKSKEDQLMDELFGESVKKEGKEQNPSLAKTTKSRLSEPTSKKQEKTAEGTSKLFTPEKPEKPSVRKELREIQNARKKEAERSENRNDSLLNASAVPQDEKVQAFIAESKNNRNRCYELSEQVTAQVATDGKMLQKYLDVQSTFDRYTTNNALLILAQRPDAQKLGDYGYWRDHGFYLKRMERQNPVLILEPGKTYKREDGTVGNYYNAKKLYDISQTTMSDTTIQKSEYKEHDLIRALVSTPPVNIVAAEPEQMPDEKGAFFKPEEGCIYVRKGMSAQEIFQNLVPELVFAGYADGNPHYDKNEDAFHVSCASYMLCKKYGMDTSRYNFLHAPEFFEKMETQEVRVELSRARDAANAISARMAKVLDQNRNATYRQSEAEKNGQDSSENVKDKKENPEPEKKEQKSRGQHRKEAR